MKSILFFTAIIPLFSFSQIKKSKKTTTSQQIFLKDTGSIKSFIINYYKKQFEKEKTKYPDARIKVSTSEEGSTTVKLQLEKNNDWGPMREIPPTSNFLIGYLNDDTTKDVVVSIFSIGLAGVKVSWSEMFVFISSNNQLKFDKLYTSYDLGTCTLPNSYNGKFYPSAIINNTLEGRTECHTATDPGCCPSLTFKTAFKFNSGLKLVSQINNPPLPLTLQDSAQ